MVIKAALDIGSSSVKLLVLELAADGSYAVLAEESRVTGLGKGVADHGLLSDAGIAATLNCLREMVGRARELGAESIRAAGTDALRRAQNRAALLDQLEAELGLTVEVLSGEDEARLSREVALRELPSSAGEVVFFDVGGGSTELTWCTDGALQSAVSLGLGARRTGELAGVSQPVSAEMQARLGKLIDGELQERAPRPADDLAPAAVQLAGLGGTASQLVWALRGWRGEARGTAHGAVVAAQELRGALGALAPLELADVKQLAYMDPARAELIYAGAAIIDGLLRFYGADQFTVIDRGLRYGLLLA